MKEVRLMGHGSQFFKKILIIYIVANLIVMALKAFTPLGQNSIFNLLAFVILSIFTVYLLYLLIKMGKKL
ncbi:conserved hypothetical protein [Pediococcus acidilactici NGRI 0510Q]|nr:hypothetical protein IV82_GL001686 [Pediococcus acidilactici]GAC45758.1 conserved hypothetical protein [Pediococcus acidilactici NGRI 0510Q]NBI14907.1 hypothetical protein [Pediococcus acidilactici]NFA45379.1 hypothetical protein [Pediococcus acidilactici]NFA46623.1 hypothetical protein [Pediococcus acidilactici]